MAVDIGHFVPPNLKEEFYHGVKGHKYTRHNGLDPYGFSTDNLLLYLPLWALKGGLFKSVDAYKHTCTANGALWRPDGRLLDGLDDFLWVPDSPLFTFLPGVPFSIIAWIYPTVIADYDGVVGKWDNAPPGDLQREWLFRFSVGAKFEFRVFDEVDNISRGRSTTDTIPTTAWTHIVGTHNGATGTDANAGTKIYINAVQKDTTDLSVAGVYDGMLNGTSLLYVGNIENQADVDFTGTVGEIWIYRNRVLSQPDITDNLNRTEWRYS